MRTSELQLLAIICDKAEASGSTAHIAPATLRELLIDSHRLAYIACHGGAWEQRVIRGELDAIALPASTRPTAPACGGAGTLSKEIA